MQEIYRIEAIFAAQMHQMLEVPTDQRTDSGEHAGGNVEGVIVVFWRNDLVCNVSVWQDHRLAVEFDSVAPTLVTNAPTKSARRALIAH